MKRNIYIFIVLSLALALPSCKIGKKYARPELDLPEEIVAGADTASIDSISWQSLYVDTTLQRLITIALDNNKDMKMPGLRAHHRVLSVREWRILKVHPMYALLLLPLHILVLAA